MSKEEVNDIWQSAKMIGIELQKHYNCTSLTFSMQDGPAAGQTVPHVHVLSFSLYLPFFLYFLILLLINCFLILIIFNII